MLVSRKIPRCEASVGGPRVRGSLGFMASALAQAPVAVVEEVKGKPSGVEFMDYVAPER